VYLEKCTIRNIKCFEEITLDFRNPDGSIRLWNVLIGENGTGKTTLLQAIAIALLGEDDVSCPGRCGPCLICTLVLGKRCTNGSFSWQRIVCTVVMLREKER
jgi:ABC-type polysaccharide/polyol phosphate transport system ATPase subunit